MTISIHIEAHPDRGPMRGQIDDAMQALGFERESAAPKLLDTGAPSSAGQVLDEQIRDFANRTIDKAVAEAAPAPKATRGKKAAAAPAAEPATPPAAEQAAISTGEERVDPNHPEDSAETQAADAADEAAETAATKTALTLDDVRTKLGEYVQKFGMDAAQADGPKVIALVCGDGINKISAIPDDQAIIAKVVAGVAEMIAKNPYQRDAVAA